MDNIQVTHNNDNHHFRIAMDIAKEGSSLWDLTPYVKGRVGDNRFGLQVTWTYQGQLMNIEGMKPYIEGNVGQYSVDDKNNLQLDPNSGVVRYVGDPADCQAGGQATYYFPEQMFPKEGIFKGYIGLLDDRDDSKNPHISGVTVWFKVLPGIAEMGHACDYYISDLEKAEEIFKAKLRQHETDFQNETSKVISDARNSYTTEVSNAHDALLALVSQIQANRDEQANLSQHLAGTEQQIEIHDVVTRPEFLDLGNRLNQQVANLRQNKTLYFQNLAELKTQYPNGTDNLCITLDDKHLHVYDYANGTWTDAGATDVITADPATKDAIYQDSSNVAPDPDFKIIDGEWLFASDLGTPNWAFESKTVDNSKVIQMHGYYNQATENNWNNTWCESRNINIAGQKVISLAWDINAKSAGQPADAHTELQLIFLDKGQNQIGKLVNNVPESQDDELHLVKWENLTPPANASFASFAVLIHGTGSVRFTKPRFNFSKTVLPFNIKEQANHVQLINTHTSTNNLVPNANLTNLDLWSVAADAGKTNYQLLDQKLNTSSIVRLYGHNAVGKDDNGNQWLTSSDFKIKGAKAISLSWMLNVNLDDQATGNVQLGVEFKDQDFNSLHSDFRATFAQNTSGFKLFNAENIVVPDTAVYANIYVMIHGSGYLDIAYPQANAGEKVLPYSETRVLSAYANTNDNLVPNANLIDLKGWNYGNDTNTAKADELSQTLNESHIARLYGHNQDLKNPSDHGNTWFFSTDFNVQMFQKIYCNWLLKINLDNLNTGMVYIGAEFKDENRKTLTKVQTPVSGNTSSFVKASQKCDVPKSAVFVDVYVLIYGSGYVDIASPVVTAISAKNNFLNSLVKHEGTIGFGKDLGGDVPHQITDDYLSFDGFHSDETNNNWNNTWLFVEGLKIQQNSRYISFDINMLLNMLLQGTGDNYLRLDFQVYDAAGNYLYVKSKSLNKNIDDFSHIYWDGLWIPDNAATFNIGFTLHNKGTVKIADIDYKFDDVYEKTSLPKLFVGNANDFGDNWQNAQFRFIDGSRTLDGYLQLAIQGDSSRLYPKKNFKTKFFTDSNCEKKLKWKPKANWQANNKFNFKANWIDATQARNLVNAQMIEKATAITPMEKLDETNALLNTQGLGQMEGIPVEVYLSDGYYGLFTLNTKKDDKSFGMDSDNSKHEIVSVELDSQVFRDPKATIDEKNYLTEIHDQPSATLKANFEKFVNFVATSSPDDFVKHLGDYIDVKSCINTMLYGILSKEYDYYSKSYLLCTWNDGAYFYMVPYDLDSTWGLFWDGSRIAEDGNDPWFDFEGLVKDPNQDSFISNHGQNRLFERIYEHFKPEVKKQYDLLRSTVWKNSDIIQAFKHFIDEIPEAAFEHEQQKWTALPSAKITDFAQIQNFIIQRGNAMDDFMNNHFLAQESSTSSAPTTSPQPTTPQAQPNQGNN